MMMTARTTAVALAAAAGLTLTACGGSTGTSNSGADGGSTGSATAPSGDCSSAEVFCVGLVTDMGKVDDKSFNQSAWEGVQAAAKETGAQTKYIETTDTKDYASNIKQFTDKKYDVVVTVGFLMAEPTVTAAGTAPDTKFIAVDQFQAKEVANVTGLSFPEDKAGYAAGYLAGLLSKSDKVGQVLGMQIPPVEKYAKGFIAGAKASNPNASVATVYHPAGDNAFSDPVWGANTAKQQLSQGIDVIFGAGGKTGNGALAEIAKAAGAGKTTFCIGVDTDQWTTVPEARPCLVTSATKELSKGTADLIKQAKDGSIKGGNFVGEVGLAPFHDLDSAVPADVKTKVDGIVKGLADDSIKTGVTLG
ncbi:MAG: BMP family ABC transporter substrate-binding protein [Micrococcales bacterium]|nr:BMP family ABC transporter substrate-binding protein [Micrococcales bacterium]